MPRFGRARGLPPFLAFDRHAVSLAEGFRAGFAMAAVVLLYEWLRWPGLMEAALAALLTCICDAGGPLRRRLPAVLAFGVAGAAATGGFALLRDSPVFVVVPLAGLFVMAASFARAFGQSALQVGNLLSVVVALSLRQTGPHPPDALVTAATFLGGNLWAVLLTAVIWRLQPYRPARAAVAASLHALARMASDIRAVAGSGADEAAWDRHARLHRRIVRERLEAAREAVLSTVRARGPASGPAAQSWLRLEAAEQLFGALIALADLLDSETRPERHRADRMLRLIAAVLGVLEREVARETTMLRPGLERAIAAIPLAAGDDPALRAIARFIAERLRATLSPSQGPDRLPVVPSPAWRDVLRASFAGDRAMPRHALRAGLAATVGFAAVLLWPAPYLHWFAITLIVTLQPYVALTLVKASERIGGAVLGGFLAAAISIVCTTPLAIAAALFPLSVAALTVRAVSFGLFMMALTPVVVLLSEIGAPGESELRIAVLRAAFTLAGGLTALLACAVLWPVWEPRRLRTQMRAAIAAHGRYAAAAIGEVLGEDAASEPARREAGAASNAFESSLQRVLLERRLRSDAALETMLTVDAALRRLAGRLSALHHAAAPNTDPAGWRALRAWILAVTARLAEGGSDIPPRPPEVLGDGDGVMNRLVRPLELAAGAMARGEAMLDEPP